jgi:hypothetical protein
MKYRGTSIEKELNGSYSVYFAGNAYATSSNFASIEAAQRYVDWCKE